MASNQKYPKSITSRSKADNKKLLICYICYDWENKQLWKTHWKDKEHSMREQFFKKDFVDLPGDLVHCKVCKANISKNSFIKHARDHEVMPWYKPKNEHELLFKNFISPKKNYDQLKYYCHLCNLVTNCWLELLIHISGKFHIRLLNDIGKNVSKKEISSTLQKELILNYISTSKSKLLRCWLCRCIIGEYKNLEAHIASETHQSKIVKKHEITLEKAKLVPVTNNDSISEPFPKYFDNFIAKPADDDYYCNLCENEYLSLALILEHMEDPVHLNLLIHERRSSGIVADTSFSFDFCQVLVENNIFKFDFSHLKCYSCKNIIFLEDSVDDHIKSHKKNIRLDSLAEANDPINLNGDDDNNNTNHSSVLSESKNHFSTYFENFIETRNKDYLCHVCKIILPSLLTVMTHIKDRDHQNLVTKERKSSNLSTMKGSKCMIFVTNGIFQVNDTKFKCHTCKIVLKSSKAAKEHILDPQHKIERQKFTDCQLSVKQENEKTTVKNEKYPEYIYSTYEDDDEKILTCFVCSITQLWKKHKMNQEHIFRRKFFLNNFSDSPGDRVMCKLGMNYIPKSSFTEHVANVHQLIPWYRPPDEFITYFKNYIFPMDYKYYCNLCDELFYRWYHGLGHTQSKNHIRKVEESLEDEDIDDEDLSLDLCKKLSVNNIFLYSSTELRCWTCNFVIDGYENADKHITSQEHMNFLRQEKTQLQGWKNKYPRSFIRKEIPPNH